MLKLRDVNCTGKTILIREDFNVPIQSGIIQDDTRVCRALETIRNVLKQNPARVILVSHLGRPVEGKFDPAFSLEAVAKRLSQLLEKSVDLVFDWQTEFPMDAKIILLENIRFYRGEKQNDQLFSNELALLADIIVFDAFASSHRAQASTEGMLREAKLACMGLLLEEELSALERAWQDPDPPIVAIVGGAKISTKLTLLKELVKKVDYLIPGGGIANTLLKAAGYEVGGSLYEADLVQAAADLLAESDGQILLPKDVVVSSDLNGPARACDLSDVNRDNKIFDIGQKTLDHYCNVLQSAKTVIWNGPLGVFEKPQFAKGTYQLAKAISELPAYSLVGGGDTIAALKQSGVLEKINYVSTGGGALLAYLEGKSLPALSALECHHL